MSNQIITTVRNTTETEKGVCILQPRTGDIKGICVNGTSFYSNCKAEPTCIVPNENGLINFEQGDNITLEAIKNGLKINYTGAGSGGGLLPLIDVSDGRTLSINTRHFVIPFFDTDNYTLYLPDVVPLPQGTIIEIKSAGAGTYKIAQKANQVIYYNNYKTTEGSSGYLQLRNGGNGNWIQLVVSSNLIEPQSWYSFGVVGTFDAN